MGISFLFKYTCLHILFCISIHNLLLTISYKNTIERTMKVTFNEKEYELKYSFRAYMIYENIMGKSFSPQGLTDMIVFFYSSL